MHAIDGIQPVGHAILDAIVGIRPVGDAMPDAIDAIPGGAAVSAPLRVVHVYNWLDPAIGGPPRVIAGLAAGQRALGHDVRLVSSDRPRAPAVDAFLAEHLDPLPPRHSVRPRFFVALATRRRLTAALRDADVAHLHGIWPPVTLLAAQTCRRLGVPYVLAPHGSLHAAALAEKPLRKRLGLAALGYAALCRHAAALHLLNDDEARVPPGVPLPARRVVIPNGVFADEFAAPVPPIEAVLPALAGSRYVLFLGRLHPGKGLDLLGDAFGRLAARFPAVQLVACGPDQGAAAPLRAAAARHGYADRLHLPGARFGAEKHALLRHAAVFCLPSRHEGHSIATLEALAHGRPVVVSAACHCPEVATVGCGVVTPLDPVAIADALAGLLADPAAADAMGTRGRAWVLARHTWPAIAARTVALYRELVSAR
ncbi:MAG: glycosyltransferase [Myxococcales bacterium]|nr:glycosyltransferase [Myxococcales bacterium]